MADQALQIAQGAGGLYVRFVEGPTVGGHPTLIPYHQSLDGGPSWTPSRKFTTSADMTTAADITDAPDSGLKVVADDILVSSNVAMEFTIQEETSATVLASVFLPTNGTVQITLRDGIKAAVADKKLQGKASIAGNVRITCCWHSEA